MRFGIVAMGALLALAACGGGAPKGRVVPPSPPDGFAGYSQVKAADGALIVTRNAPMFTYSDGAEARGVADKMCPNGVNSSINDRFQGGAWIFPEGCK